MFWNHGNFRAVTFRLDPLFLLVKSPFRLNHTCDRLPISAEIPFFSGEISFSFRVIGDISISAGDISNSWWVNHIFLLVQSQFLPNISFCQAPPWARSVADDLGSLAIAWGLHTSAFFHEAQDLGGRAHHLRPAANRWDPLNRVAIEIYPNNGATWRSESEVKMFSLLRDCLIFRAII